MIFIECKFQLSKIITNPFSFHIPFYVCSAVIIIRMRNFDFILWQLWQWNDLRELLLLSKIMWSFMALIWDEMEINSLIRDILFSKERLQMKNNIDVWAIWNKLGFKGAIRVILSGFFRLHWSLYDIWYLSRNMFSSIKANPNDYSLYTNFRLWITFALPHQSKEINSIDKQRRILYFVPWQTRSR